MKITLANLKDATAQQVFEQIATHLLNQGEKSIDPDNINCRYKNKEGFMCAAGCLLSDDEYSTDFEGEPWSILIDKYDVPHNHGALIGRFQCIHDSANPCNWKEELIEAAKHFQLNSTFINSVQDNTPNDNPNVYA